MSERNVNDGVGKVSNPDQSTRARAGGSGPLPRAELSAAIDAAFALDAAFRAGAEAMREQAARTAGNWNIPTTDKPAAIRALPLPERGRFSGVGNVIARAALDGAP